jgi:hypothetical protein
MVERRPPQYAVHMVYNLVQSSALSYAHGSLQNPSRPLPQIKPYLGFRSLPRQRSLEKPLLSIAVNIVSRHGPRISELQGWSTPWHMARCWYAYASIYFAMLESVRTCVWNASLSTYKKQARRRTKVCKFVNHVTVERAFDVASANSLSEKLAST